MKPVYIKDEFSRVSHGLWTHYFNLHRLANKPALMREVLSLL